MEKRNFLKNQKGFTLVEIIAVLVILGILAAVAIPKFINLQEEARNRSLDGAISQLELCTAGFKCTKYFTYRC